ncbi:tol-pal system protein YbgF [Aliikangiella sp. IMCC44632]
MKGKPFLMVATLVVTNFLSLVVTAESSLEQRIQYLEQQVSTRAQLQTEMSMQLTALQREVKELRGIVEEHQFKLQQIQERQRDLYRDIDSRLSALPQGQVAVAANNTNSTPSNTNTSTANSVETPKVSGGERSEFEAAFGLVRNRQYAEAIKQFESFLVKYPAGAYSDNARFWIGQVYFAQSNLAAAEQQFNTLVATFPDSSKVPNALLKLAEIKVKQEQWSEAKRIYNEVVTQYSGASQQLARKGLRDIKQQGH